MMLDDEELLRSVSAW